MVAHKLRHGVLALIQQKPHHSAQRVDQQRLLVRRLFLHERLADVEDVADIHAVDAVQLHLLRRMPQDVLDRVPQRRHFFQQTQQGGIGFSHGFARRRCSG